MAGSLTKNAINEDLSTGHVLYGLMSGFALFFLPLFLALLINFMQPRANGTLLDSHLKWQRDSIMYFLVGCFVAYMVTGVWLALSILVLSILWFVYRIIKGWISLVDGQFI